MGLLKFPLPCYGNKVDKLIEFRLESIENENKIMYKIYQKVLNLLSSNKAWKRKRHHPVFKMIILDIHVEFVT